ncbi:MAG: hypothetical protein ACYS7Y_30050 [Planctomycetota bacterium]|jgi:hypothetical protein
MLGTVSANVLTSAVLFGIAFVTGCAKSHGVAIIVEKMRSATHIQIKPRLNLFESLAVEEGVSFSRHSIQDIGLPANITITDSAIIEKLAEFFKSAGFRKKHFAEYPDTVSSMTIRVFHDEEMIGRLQMDGNFLSMPRYGTLQTDLTLKDLRRELRAILPYGDIMENVVRRDQDLSLIGVALVTVVDSKGGTSILQDRWCDHVVEYASTLEERTLSDLRSQQSQTEDPYGEYAELIDVKAMRRMARGNRVKLERILAVDSPGSRQCAYALNSQYREASPEDTVVVFEAESGWNRTGGPELLSDRFTDPNGCFLYLKDNSVEFITNDQITQIKEEAQRLAKQNQVLEFRFSTLLKTIEAGRVGLAPPS